MKSYKEVVNERYNGSEKNVHPYDNIYSLLNPIGFYGDSKIRKAFYKAFNVMRSRGADITRMNILDLGCGKGATTRFFSEMTGKPQQVFGVDLSEHRIECAKAMNPTINYVVGDIVNPPVFPVAFDLVTALDVFMHLKTRDEIMAALENINKQLKNDGYFIWYDVYASDHYKTTAAQDHSGFHPKQMMELAKEAGFQKVFELHLFKRILWRYHSLYFIKRFPEFVVNLLEKTPFGNPGNMLMLFSKKA